MYATGNSYYIDIEGQIRIIPEDRVDLLQQSMPTLLPTKGKGHGLTVFDNPTINKMLSKPGRVHFAPQLTTEIPQAQAAQPTHGSILKARASQPILGSHSSSPVFSQSGFSCDTPQESLPSTLVSSPSRRNLENYSGGTDSTHSRMRTRSRTQGSINNARHCSEQTDKPTGSSQVPSKRNRKKRKR